VYLGSTYARLRKQRQDVKRFGVAALIVVAFLCIGVYGTLSLPEPVQQGMCYALIVIGCALAYGVFSGTFYERAFAPMAYVYS
jgi:hypothetical protein